MRINSINILHNKSWRISMSIKSQLNRCAIPLCITICEYFNLTPKEGYPSHGRSYAVEILFFELHIVEYYKPMI